MKSKTPLTKAHEQAERIFQELLPRNGLAIRPVQIELCHEMLDAMFCGQIALCDAGVGIGKTHAYLVAGLLWQKYRPLSLPHTLTVSTSSVALQEAIFREYLPMLSRILVQDGLLEKPVRAVIRKGRERYVCDTRLMIRQTAVKDSEKVSQRRKEALFEMDKKIDMDEAAGLSAYDRAQICVPAGCPHECGKKHDCRYRNFLKDAKRAEVDIQICNHNYLLADAIHRRQQEKALLKDFHILIVDEAHKLAETARQMYGETVTLSEIHTLCTLLKKEHCGMTARQLRLSTDALAGSLKQGTEITEQENNQQPFMWTQERNKAITEILALLQKPARMAKKCSRTTLYELERTAETLSIFSEEHSDRIRYIQTSPNGELSFCAVRLDTPARLVQDLWRTGRPAILASGTFAAGGSFASARQKLGLETVMRCREFSAASPFDYEKNSLLYIPDASLCANTESTVKLLYDLLLRTHGHALVLFTSYIFMSEICEKLRGMLPFPLLEMQRGRTQIVQQFRQMSNAVLCAAGSCWEGVDFPGDMVSLLVIVRLPFPMPDPVREAEKQQYRSLREYIDTVIVPEMQTKLRQGAGRAIRTETDTCVIAILDRRAGFGGRYHDAVCQALPPCQVTASLKEVENFIRAKKSPDYFLPCLLERE